MRYTIITLLLLSAFLVDAQRTNVMNQQVELGKVSWFRDYEEATSKAASEDKMVLILFQEVPGCATCRNYGTDVLSNPLMVDAIEELFIPLVIFNNKAGKDATVLSQFLEPSWNNPVVRIIDAKGNNIVQRVSGNYSAKGLYTAMEEALGKNRTKKPEYFKLLGEELSVNQVEETYYSMFCFWSGEKQLAKPEGVLSTEAGFMKGHEVVKVEFNPEVISKEELDQYAKNQSCNIIQADKSYRIDKDPQYYLKQTPYRYLALTGLQKTKINSALGQQKDPSLYLSPTQLKYFEGIEQNNNAKLKELYTLEFAEAWALMNQF